MEEIKTPWRPSRYACQFLQVSDSTLYKYRKLGFLKPGLHWKYKFQHHPKSGILYDLEACDKALREMAETPVETLELVRLER